MHHKQNGSAVLSAESQSLNPAFVWLVMVPTGVALLPLILISLAIAYPSKWWEKQQESLSLEQEFLKEVQRRQLTSDHIR
jgi:hypothetical protein